MVIVLIYVLHRLWLIIRTASAKIGIPLHYPVLSIYKWGFRGYTFHGHVFLMFRIQYHKMMTSAFDQCSHRASINQNPVIIMYYPSVLYMYMYIVVEKEGIDYMDILLR